MKSLFYTLGTMSLIVLILIKGAFIIKPLVLGLVIAMIMHPAVSSLQSKLKYHSISFFLTFLISLTFISSIFLLISVQLFDLFSTLESDKFSVENLELSIETFLNGLGFTSFKLGKLLSDQINTIVASSTSVISSILSNGTSILITTSLGLVFSYFFSAYYYGLKECVLDIFSDFHRPKINRICDEAPSVIRKYLHGMSLVMLILAVVNSIIYSLIGLEYALVWGLLSGLLALIPYVGSAIALLLPLSYSMIISDDITQPLIIMSAFIAVQQLEGNILTPKIVGDAVDINPLAAIIFMIISGQIWGIFGVFISIMMAGILKIVLEQWKDYRDFAKLLSDEIE